MKKYLFVIIMLANLIGCASTQDEELKELSLICNMYADGYVLADKKLKRQTIDQILERLLLMYEAVNLPEGGDLVIDVMLLASNDAHTGIANNSAGENLKMKAHNYCLSEYNET